jgi:vancomycin permeability regulator SanA
MRTDRKKKRKIIKGIVTALLIFALICSLAIIVMGRIIIDEGSEYILTEAEAAVLSDVDCILILGAGVYNNKYPSLMLRDRLAKGVDLYALGVSDRLLMSGDNSKVNYNEVLVMKDYAADAGVPREHVFRTTPVLHL